MRRFGAFLRAFKPSTVVKGLFGQGVAVFEGVWGFVQPFKCLKHLHHIYSDYEHSAVLFMAALHTVCALLCGFEQKFAKHAILPWCHTRNWLASFHTTTPFDPLQTWHICSWVTYEYVVIRGAAIRACACNEHEANQPDQGSYRPYPISHQDGLTSHI